MTESEKLAMLKNLSGETDEEVLLTFLTLAGHKIIQRAYPYRADIEEVPAKYATNQVEIACYLLNKRGAEGETAHSENGISRMYENADVPDSMLTNVIPYCGLV